MNRNVAMQIVPKGLARLGIACALAWMAPAWAGFTGTVAGDSAFWFSDGTPSSVTFAPSGLFLQHSAAGFNSLIDFDSSVAGDQTIPWDNQLLSVNTTTPSSEVVSFNGVGGEIRLFVGGFDSLGASEFVGANVEVLVNPLNSQLVVSSLTTATASSRQTVFSGSRLVLQDADVFISAAHDDAARALVIFNPITAVGNVVIHSTANGGRVVFQGDMDLFPDISFDLSDGYRVFNGTVTGGSGLMMIGFSTLGGIGELAMPVSMAADGAFISPGEELDASAGCFTTGAITVAGTGGNFDMNIDGPAACSGHDRLRTPALAMNAPTSLNLLWGASMSAAAGTVLTLIEVTGPDPVTGTFNGLPEGATVIHNGVTYTLSYQGGDGNDVTLTATAVGPGSGVTAVPLLSPLGLGLLSGLLGLSAFTRRRRG